MKPISWYKPALIAEITSVYLVAHELLLILGGKWGVLYPRLFICSSTEVLELEEPIHILELKHIFPCGKGFWSLGLLDFGVPARVR